MRVHITGGETIIHHHTPKHGDKIMGDPPGNCFLNKSEVDCLFVIFIYLY